MLCPSCSAASLDAFGRCPHCGYCAAPPARPYAAYYPQPTLVTPTAPAGVGLAAQILLAVSGVLALVGFGSNIWAFTVAKTAYDTAGANTDAVTAVSGLAGIFAVLSVLLGLATGVVFIIWFYKSATLAAILAPGRQALSSGWAIGGWFLPLGWYVLPRVVAGGVWRAAIPLAAEPVLRKPRTYLVTWWWLSFCVGQTWFSTPVSPSRGDLNSWGTVLFSFSASGFADLCRVTSAVLGIVMIRKLTQMQQVRILQGPGVGHPYASPVAANVPYAAYAEPSVAPFGVAASFPDQSGPYSPYGPYGPATGTPYAPAQPQAASLPQPQPQDAARIPAPNATGLPPQAQPPAQESLPATKVEPAAGPDKPVTEAAEALAETAPDHAAPADAVPADSVPVDAVPADVPTAVIPRQAQDRATVLLTPVVPAPQELHPGAESQPEAASGAGGGETPEPQDAVPSSEPHES